MDEKVFFKIIIPNYNNIAYLPQCLDSILNQTFQDFKIILVDDQSTDFSYELAKSYERKHPDKIVVLRAETKRYAGGCRNIGIDYPLDCEYYMFIDSDDYLYLNDSLQILFNNVINKPDVLLYTWCRLINGNIKIFKFKKYDLNELASCNWNSSWSKLVKKNRIQYFLEKCMYGEDTYQFLRVMDFKNLYVKQIENIIYVYRQNAYGVTQQKDSIHTRTKDIFYNSITKLMWEAKTQYIKNSIWYRLNRDNKLTQLTDIKKNNTKYLDCIPKNLFMIWFGKKPVYVDYVFNLYKKINPDFNVCLYYEDNILKSKNKDILDCYQKVMTPNTKYNYIFSRQHFNNKQFKNSIVFNTAFSDAFRFYLVDKYGGIYVDCDTIPVKPFDTLLLKEKYFQCMGYWDGKDHPDLYFFGSIAGNLTKMPEQIECLECKDMPVCIASEVKYENKKIKMMELFEKNKLQYGDCFCNNPDTYINHFNRRTTRWETYTK